MFHKRTFVGLVVLLTAHALGAQTSADPAPITLNMWVAEMSPRTKGFQRTIREYEHRHPHIRVNLQLIPILAADGTMDAQKLMCGVAGGAPPDIIEQDRFSIGDWASRGAFTALDELIEQSQATEYPIQEEDFYAACWKEAVYDGKVYAIPNRTDARLLYYNKDFLERYELVDENGEAKPPRTWKELMHYLEVMTSYDEDGQIAQAGFLPIWGNTWLYLYGFANGGKFMSDDGRTCTLDDPKIAEALQFMTDMYDKLGGRDEVTSFESTFQPESQDPFLQGRVAMRIDVDVPLQLMAQYRPDMRVGVAPPPVPEGMPPVTWSGGFSYAIPNGAQHRQESWELIQFLVSREGFMYSNRAQRSYNRSRGKAFIPTLVARQSVAPELFEAYGPENPMLRECFREFLRILPESKFRPVTPVGQLLWDCQVKSAEEAMRHRNTPEEALKKWTRVVQTRLDQLYAETDAARVDWGLLGRICGIVALLALVVYAAYFIRTLRSLARRKEALAGLLFVSPWLVGFVVFAGGPILASIVISLCNFDVLHPAEFVGLANYKEMLFEDGTFWLSLWNTIYMMASVPLALAIGLALAMLVSIEVRGTAVFRTLFYLPAIVPAVAGSMLWIWLLNPQVGLVNLALGLFGVDGPNWLTDVRWSKPSIILMLLWTSGASMVIWLAGLKGIPAHLYEAAHIDGAGHWGQFRNVTVPMLSPYIFFNLIMGIIATFQIFAQAYIMTNGGPADSTLFFVFYLFHQAYKYLRMGYASAMAWILFLIIMGLTLLNLKLAPRWVHYEGEQN